jgi:hypothetical protein
MLSWGDRKHNRSSSSSRLHVLKPYFKFKRDIGSMQLRSLQQATGSSSSSSSPADGRFRAVKSESSSSRQRSSSSDAYAAARVISMPPPDTHNVVHAITPEAAEAIAYSDPSGIHRLATPGAADVA